MLVVVLVAVAAVVAVPFLKAAARRRAADAIEAVPAPTEYVLDLARVIDPSSKRALLGYLQELEEKTGAQVIVLTVVTTGGVPIEEFSLALADKWKLGRKGKDDGALVVVAVSDRAYRFEIGRGLEGPLPDAFVGRIGRQYFVPYFRQGKYGEGLFLGVVAMLTKLQAEYGVALTGLPRVAPPSSLPSSPGSSVGQLLLTLFIVLIVIILIARRLPFFFFPTGGYRGSWGSVGWTSRGGGWGGGGFGSFGGGGGGSFGGGGASGRW